MFTQWYSHHTLTTTDSLETSFFLGYNPVYHVVVIIAVDKLSCNAICTVGIATHVKCIVEVLGSNVSAL